jgi:hypothetical protein
LTAVAFVLVALVEHWNDHFWVPLVRVGLDSLSITTLIAIGAGAVSFGGLPVCPHVQISATYAAALDTYSHVIPGVQEEAAAAIDAAFANALDKRG